MRLNVRLNNVQEERQTVVENACPGPGACGGMYTANTMASAIEVRLYTSSKSFDGQLHLYCSVSFLLSVVAFVGQRPDRLGFSFDRRRAG